MAGNKTRSNEGVVVHWWRVEYYSTLLQSTQDLISLEGSACLQVYIFDGTIFLKKNLDLHTFYYYYRICPGLDSSFIV